MMKDDFRPLNRDLRNEFSVSVADFLRFNLVREDEDDPCGLLKALARKEAEGRPYIARENTPIDSLTLVDRGIVVSVNQRLVQWMEYELGYANNKPYSKDTVGEVAEAIFKARMPMKSSRSFERTPNLTVSPATILQAHKRAEKGDKYIFF